MFTLTTTFSVITLPVLAPIAALLQLLFPGLLRDQWKQYRIVITVLLTQSTLFMIHWALITFFITDRLWWLSDASLTFAIVCVAALGLIVALQLSRDRVARLRRRLAAYHAGQARAEPQPEKTAEKQGVYIPPVPSIHPLSLNAADRAPAKVEYAALIIFAAMGLFWASYQLLNQVSPLDQVAIVTVACVAGLLHLIYRKTRTTNRKQPIFATTEVIFLFTLVITGSALGYYLNQSQTNLTVERTTSDWPTYRGNKHRTGVIDGSSAPKNPALLWSFDPGERKGRVMFHSTPTVVDGRVYIGALHEIQTFAQGYLYCINANENVTPTDAGKPIAGAPGTTLAPGSLIWKFTAAKEPGGSAKPIFCAATVYAGIVYVGEGYHEDTGCRLFALHSGTGKTQWTVRTNSHTESSPTITPGRIIFGAGDDGILCYDLTSATEPSPKLHWQTKNLHIDSAPCVVDGRVFIGTVIGDIHDSLAVLALDAETGKQIWKVNTPLPVPGCASHSNGRIYVGLGNGKLGLEADKPAGAVWCLDAKTGEKLWTFDTKAAVYSTPALANGHCYFTSYDHHVYCLDDATGNLKWKVNLGSPLTTAPVVTSDDVVVITVEGIVKCLNAADGKVRWSFDQLKTPDADVYASPTLSGGRLYVAVRGKVHCLGDKP